MHINIRTLYKWVAYIYIFTTISYGFWYNFFHFRFIVDFFGLLLFILFLANTRGKFSFNKNNIFFYILLVLFCVGCILISIISTHSITLSIFGVRDYVFYLIFGLSFIGLDDNKIYLSVLDAISKIGGFLCLFGVIQFLFYNYLPPILRLYGNASYVAVYDISNIAVTRVGGMLDNPIVFGGFTVVIFTTIITKLFIYGFNWIDFVLLVFSFAACVFTYGRVSFVGIIFCFALSYYICSPKNKINKILFLLLLAIIIFIIISLFFSDTIIVQRLLGVGLSTQRSNDIHAATISNAWNTIKNNWLFGVGMATQGYSRGNLITLITDGCWFACMLEWGIPLFTFHLLLILSNLFNIIKFTHHNYSKLLRWATAVCVTISTFWLLSSWINSAYTAKCNYCIFWIVVGTCIGLVNHNDREDQKQYETQ